MASYGDVFRRRNRKVFCGIAMDPIMEAISMVIGQQQRSFKAGSIGLHSSRTHSNLLRDVIDAKEQ
ncbi:hypothetical protein PIB30_113458, partial [Stylosanthes scabra]|nr:hypothetical protein [Stylosanthes scabra]